MVMFILVSFSFFFFKQKTAYEMRISDWSSDVCSSDLEPPHRQPASRPLGSPGRSGPVALLPQPRRRPAAHLRAADHVLAPDEQEPGGWRGDRKPLDFQGDRDRAKEGRGAQLRHPQTGRRI